LLVSGAAAFGCIAPEASVAQLNGRLNGTDQDNAAHRLFDRFETPERSAISTEPVIPAQINQALPPPNAHALHFTFREAEVSGSTVFKAVELSALFAPFSGRVIPIARLYDVTAEIGRKYVEAGYYPPYVIVPPQKISHGTVRIEVREFAVDAVTFVVDGERADDRPALRALAEKIVAAGPLTTAMTDDIRRRITQAGYAIRDIHLRPGRDGTGAVTVDLATDAGMLTELEHEVRIPARLDNTQPPPDADKISFTLHHVEVTGSSVYGTEQLQALTAKWVGQEITLARLFDIAGEIGNRYRADGYIETRVLVPAQTVADGRVRLEVHEFRVDKVVVELDGKPVPAGSMLQRIANRALRVQPLTAEAVSRAAQMIGDLPGIRIVEIVPPDPDGDTAVVRVTRKTMGYDAGFNNRGTRSVGPYQALATVTANSLFGFDEKLSVTAATSGEPRELQMFSGLLDLPLTSDGLKLTTSLSNTKARPGDLLRIHDPTSSGTSFSARLSYPFIRLPSHNLSGYVQYDQLNSDSRAYPYFPQYLPFISLLGTTRVHISQDKLRNIRLGGSYDMLDGLGGLNRVSAQFSQGLKILGARMDGISIPDSAFPLGPVPLPLPSPGGNLEYRKGYLELQRQQFLPGGFAVLGGIRGQYTGVPLPAAEKFNFGGADIGRGLQAAAISGDIGYAVKTEFQYNWAAGLPYFNGAQLYLFYDWGTVWDDGPADNDKTVMATTGMGARMSLTSWLSGEVEFGRPLIRGYYNDNNKLTKAPNLFFGLMVSF
jgi:Hemolysin activation/secretion protein